MSGLLASYLLPIAQLIPSSVCMHWVALTLTAIKLVALRFVRLAIAFRPVRMRNHLAGEGFLYLRIVPENVHHLCVGIAVVLEELRVANFGSLLDQPLHGFCLVVLCVYNGHGSWIRKPRPEAGQGLNGLYSGTGRSLVVVGFLGPVGTRPQSCVVRVHRGGGVGVP